jgi:hypothetical protein
MTDVLDNARETLDPLSSEKRATMTADMLQGLAEQGFKLELIQASNLDGDADPVPTDTNLGMLPDPDNGEYVHPDTGSRFKTYGQRRREIREGMDAIRDRVTAGVLERAEEILASRRGAKKEE